ncbi:HrpJ domain-containing protein [Pandoraea fibrosis]|uniref:SepL/TyeA/HrpJ family type III secretion system gatekeeper n=1 Tax=Pandoraea fibrosis TaxID=1891094 RepID=A0A5E4SNT5_9BURK|nr:HrpJ domain-containing protein [Pandoraea fibrosis]VVD76751.1 SepL/TyeA/HrpJ family type III secretion system gatekeeper [Pandoraea fibrosis]
MANIDLSRVTGPRQATAPGAFGQEAGANKLVLTQSPRGSLFAGKDSLSSLLAAMAQKQAVRRVEKPAKGTASKRRNSMSETQKAELARVRTLIQSGGANFGAAYEHTRNLFPVPEELALVLAGLLEDEELDAKTKQEIDDALAALIREYGHARLSAGLNTGHVVNTFASRLNIDANDLRAAYRTLVGAGTGEAVTYRYLIDKFGFERRGLALEFLECALAADLASDVPSHPPEAFQPMLDLLFQLRLIRSADDLLLTSARERNRRKRASTRHDEPDLFDQVLVDLLIASLFDIQNACRHLTHCLLRWREFAGADNVMDWAGRILRAMADLPVELFPDLAYRQALLSALCEVVDDIFLHRRGSVARLGSLHA